MNRPPQARMADFGTTEMGNEEALQKLKEGAFLICLDVPKGMHIGIDYHSYNVGEKFMGWKMIPAGLHFVYYACGHDMLQGFFLSLIPGQVHVAKYDPATEDMCDANADETERMARAVHGRSLDQHLAPYPFKSLAAWYKLSGKITENRLKSCRVPPPVRIVAGDLQGEVGEEGTKEGQLTPFFENVARTVSFTPVPEVAATEEMSVAERSRLHMDGSVRVAKLVSIIGSVDELLGEVQLSFLTFLLVASHSSLEQWKVLIDLICSAEDYITAHPNFAQSFLAVLQAQLELTSSDDLFADELIGNNFLRRALSSILEICIDCPALQQEARRFQAFGQKKFGVDILDEVDPEDLPVVVEYTQDEVGYAQDPTSCGKDEKRPMNIHEEPPSAEHSQKTKMLDEALSSVTPSWAQGN